MAEASDRLYRVEYAKSGRASCKKCGDSIAKDSLRMAIMVQVRARGAGYTLQGTLLLGAFARPPTLGHFVQEVSSSVDGGDGLANFF